jgi:hypothetical protein
MVEVLAAYDTTSGGTKSDSGDVVFQGRPRKGIKAVFSVRLVGTKWLIDDIATVASGHTL